MFLRILSSIQKNKHHLVFILSIIFSISLIYNSSNSKNNYHLNSIDVFVGYIKSPFIKLSDLTKTEMENKLLREQLILLSLEKESLLVQSMENDRLKAMLDLKQSLQIYLIPAKVTNMGLTANLIAMTINIGSVDGVQKNDPVMTHLGVIGKVYSVSNNYSTIQLINDSDFRMGVKFLPSEETGILRWKSNNICEVREVYKNAQINVGDIVTTSGMSDIFPDDLPVGKVVSVVSDRIQFQKIVNVKIDERLNNLRYVYVIINRND